MPTAQPHPLLQVKTAQEFFKTTLAAHKNVTSIELSVKFVGEASYFTSTGSLYVWKGVTKVGEEANLENAFLHELLNHPELKVGVYFTPNK